MHPSSFMVALAVVIATISILNVEGYYYNRNYCYRNEPKLCTSTYYNPNTIKACPISSCHYSRTYNKCCLRYFTYDNVLYKQCTCNRGTTCAPRNATIDDPPAETTQSSTTTTTPTTTSSTTPSTTITLTTTSTTTSTIASTTTSTTTTPAFRSLCDSGFRLLNGDSVSHCAYNGIANVTMFNDENSACNAVYAPATVNGVYKPSFITASMCKNMIENINNTNIEIQIGTQKFPLSPFLFNVVTGPNGLAFIESRYPGMLSDLGCQKAACPYNKLTMVGKVNFSDCKIVGWGASDTASLSSDGLREAKITINPGGCANIPDLEGAANTVCFRTISGANLNCARDLGSPIYCKAPSNGEWILVGVTAHQDSCDFSPEVKVLPYPG